jgi:hypothetical protein
MRADEERLPGGVGNGGLVVRVGDTVRRPVGPQTPAVQAFLAHLAIRGFAGAPRPLGYDEQGREVLSYLPGQVPFHEDPPPWCVTDEVLVSVVRLVRALHDAARGFVPPDDAVWAWPPPPAYRGELIGHNDLCRENVVFDATYRPYALLDFDFAGPATPEWELAAVVRHWVLALPGDRIARMRLVLDAYPVDPGALTRALLDRLDWGLHLVRTRAEAGEPGFVAMWAGGLHDRNRSLHAWVAEHLPR